jgi:hypothetical protein
LEKEKVIISFSGGRTSAYMTKWMLDNLQDKFEMKVVYANTGKEREQTLEFINQCSNFFGYNVVWVEAVTHQQNGIGVTANVVTYETASRNGEPFEAMIAKHGIPNAATPHCTRELKAQAIRAYARQIGWKKYFTAIGIRADEPKRLDWQKAQKEKLLYPLANMRPTNKSDVNLFWSKQPFDLELKSYEGNCDLCWKKGFRKLQAIVKDNTKLAEWWQEMEIKYENYLPESRKHNEKIKPPFRFFRDNTTVEEIIEDAKFLTDYPKDESKDIDMFKQMSIWDYELDRNDGCVESCEVF